LADAFTAIADVFELVGARAKPIERTRDKAVPVVCAHDKAELERVLGPKPKTPLTIGRLYYLDHAKAASAQNPDLNGKAVKRYIAAQWENISDEERQTYMDRYTALKLQYDIDTAAYNARKNAFLSTYTESLSTARLAETHTPSVLPGPSPEPERVSPPVSLGSPPLTTVSFTEPDCSTLSISQGPPPPSIEHLDELQSSMISVLPGSPPPPTELLDELQSPVMSASPDYQPSTTVCVTECEPLTLSLSPGAPPTEPLGELQSPMQSVSPGPQPQPTPYLHVPRQPTPPISSGPLPQPTVLFAEPERSTLSKSPSPPPRPTEQQHEDTAPNVPDYVLDLKLGPRPKPPAPADRMYCESATKDILRENLGMHSIEAVRLAHIRWNSLSEEDRQPFKDRFDALAIQFKVDIDAYNVRKEAFLSTYSEPLSTMRIADPEPSTSSLSPGPPHWLIEQQYQDAEPNIDEVMERELGPRPKPPAPADRMYCESATKDILRENPGMHSIEAVRLAHIRWNSLSEEDRQTLKDRCDALSKQYQIDIVAYDARKEAFLSTHGESVSTAYPNVADEVSRQEFGLMPKRPPPAIRLYIRRVAGDIRRENPGMGFKTIEMLATTRWKNLSEAGRRPFVDHHHALKRRYKAGIAAYNAYKEAFLSAHGESVPKTPIADPEPSTSSLSPGPPIQPTVSGAGPEPEPSTLSKSRGHPPKLRKQQNKDDVLERELGQKPSRPQYAVRLYSNSVIGDIRRENPGMHYAEILSVASIRWRNLSEEDRRPFEDRHYELKRRYNADITAYNARKEAFLSTHGESVSTTPIADPEPSTSSLSPGPPIQPTVPGAEPKRSTLSKSRGHPPKLRKQQNKDDVLDRELGPKPIRPQHAVRLYYNSVIGDIRRENPGMKCAEILSVAATRWRNLSEEDRRPFEDRYYELKRKYNADIAAYNARKEVFLSTHGESVSTTPIADPEPSTSSLSPGPPIQPTVSGAEPEPSTSYLSRGPPPQSTKQQNMDDVLDRELGPKPIRPQPAVRLYFRSIVDDVRRENPGKKGAESFPVASIRWKNLSKEDRRPFEDRYYELKMKYNADIAAYNARKEAFLSTYGESVSTTPIADRDLSTSTLSSGLPHRLTGKRHQGAKPNVADDVLERVLGPRPKPPAPADRLYCESATKDILRETPGMPSIEAVRLAHIRWNSLSDEDRRPFKGRYDALKRKYNADFAAYNARKEAFLSTYSESVLTTRIADRELSTLSISPGSPLQPTEQLNKPECATASVPQTQLPPIDPLDPSGPVGYPAPSLSLLTPGAASWFTIPPHVPWSAPLSESVSRPAGHRGPSLPAESSGTVALAHPLSISWPAELALPDQSPALSSLPANSDGLPEPTMAIEHSILPTQATATATATLALPVVPLESLPVGIRPMSLDIPDTTETVALVNSPVLPFSMGPPTLEKESPLCALPINPVESVRPAELPTATKTKAKKKKRRAADNDDDVQEPGADQSTSLHRKKAKRAKIDMKEGKKKHKPKPVVKTEDNVEEAATNKENDNAGLDTVAQTPV
ncbi:hypothetical protein GGI03_002990, partial [Coemansia sp. RSA 2337]